MKILVTGAGGLLGKHIVERFLVRNYRGIRCLVRDPAKAVGLEQLNRIYGEGALEVVTGNLKSRDDCDRAIRDISLVIHSAAAMKGSAADMFLDTVVGSRNLLDAITASGTERVVLISSFGVYSTAELGRGSLVTESTPLEPHPERRDVYSHTKLRQEQLFVDYQKKNNFELVTLRPGVIYGPGSGHISGRVGLNLFGFFLHLGNSNILPLTHVVNCAEAVVVAALKAEAAGEVYNVVDDDLPTSRDYLNAYKKQVRKIRTITVPYTATMWLSKKVEAYHSRSAGQLPAVFTPYKTKSTWGGNRFSNAKLKSIGWKPIIPTSTAIQETFLAFRTQ